MKTAIITGASRGVGRATAETFAKKGYRLIINCRSNFELLDEVAAYLSKYTDVYPVHGAITGDILASALKIDLNSLQPVISEEAEIPQDSALDADSDEIILVNNAGISTFNLAQDVSDDEFDTMLEANVSDMFKLTRAVIPYILKTQNGRIVNISSVWGVVGASMESVYSLTKGAINAFTEALGKELAPNHIPVNAVAIGCVDTDMNKWLEPSDREKLEEEIPYGRMAEPSEVADFIFLMTQAPRYLTGQIIKFDGGWI